MWSTVQQSYFLMVVTDFSFSIFFFFKFLVMGLRGSVCKGYYSYLYARCFASTIWQKICQEDPLSSRAGSALRKKFLQHGGAKDPADILNDLVGHGVISHRFGGIVPNITSLSQELGLKSS